MPLVRVPTPATAALAFARQHDWGRSATLRRDRSGRWWLAGLIEAYTLNGLYHEERVAVRATLAAARKFGAY